MDNITNNLESLSPEETFPENIINDFENQNIVEYTFKYLTDKGFVVDYQNHDAFISFPYLPWSYYDKTIWSIIEDSLINLKFQAKIFNLNKTKNQIILNSKYHLFNEAPLEMFQKMEGIVISISNYGYFIEVGGNLNWEYGSVVGLLHNNYIKPIDEEAFCPEVTDLVEVYYIGENQQGKPKFSNYPVEHYEGEEVIFTIKNILTNGFYVNLEDTDDTLLIKTDELPWSYKKTQYWNIVSDSLKIFSFKGVIKKIRKKYMHLSAKNMPLETPVFKNGESYKGIVLEHKTEHLILEFGHNFKWLCGSIIADVRKKYIKDAKDKTFVLGQEIELRYWNQINETYYFGDNEEEGFWINSNTYNYLYKEYLVNVKKDDANKLIYSIEGLDVDLRMDINSQVGIRKIHQNALRNLKDGDIINCEIISINKKKKHFLIAWKNNQQINEISNRNTNKLTDLPKKNNKISFQKKEMVQIEVLKTKTDTGVSTEYLVSNELKARLIITNPTVLITQYEKTLIENNFQDGQLLECEFISERNDVINVHWVISEENLNRFITQIG